jgi:hypothetical protein
MSSENHAGWMRWASCHREREIYFAYCTIKRITLAMEFYRPFFSNMREALVGIFFLF